MAIHSYAAKGDLQALKAEVERGASFESVDEGGYTPLMAAVTSPCATVDLVRFLLDQGADVNAHATTGDNRESSVLGLAAKLANLEKIRLLVERGADIHYIDKNGYSILLKAVYRTFAETQDERMSVLDYLIAAGAPLDVASKYSESVLSVCSQRGDFVTVKYLLDRGADPAPLGWTPLHLAVAFGMLDEVQRLIDQGASMAERDAWERTPFLLSVHAGHQDIAQFLLDRGSDRSATGRCGHTAPMLAICRDDAAMLNWLINQGWDVEEADEFGNFPLALAAGNDATACVAALLQAGAAPSRQDEYGERAISATALPAIVELLVDVGEELSDVGPEMRSRLTKIELQEEIDISEADYRNHRHRTFGQLNPERMNNRFWEAMIRTRAAAYSAGAKFGELSCDREPVWCFSRFGQSFTQGKRILNSREIVSC